MLNRPAVLRREWPALIVAFLYFFCVLAAYYVIRPVRDQLSASVGSPALPFFYAATFITSLVLTPLFGGIVARFPRRRFLPIVYLCCIAGMLIFIPLFRLQPAIDPKLLGVMFFVWVSVFNLFVVSVFWSFMADLFDPDQAHRLFPLIAMGGGVGALVGPVMTRLLVYRIGVDGLLMVSAVLLGVAIAAVLFLVRWSSHHPMANEADRNQRVIGGGFFSGAVETFRSPFLREMALLMLLGEGVGTIVYAVQTDFVKLVYTTAEARTAFFSEMDFWTNLLAMLLQVSVTRGLMSRFGSGPVLIIATVLNALVLAGMVFMPPWWIIAVILISRGGAYGMFKPAMDSLYAHVDAESKYKGKGFIDTAVWRLSDLLSTSIFSLARGAGITVGAILMGAASAAAVAGWLGRRIARNYDVPAVPAPEREA